jgi:membrane fusion protein, copper/silver efflux system
MSRLSTTTLLLTGIAAAGAIGYWTGQNGLPRPVLEVLAATFPQEAAEAADASGPIVYYRHPDGDFVYSAGPRQTDDGRAFVPVHASQEVSFDPLPEPKPEAAAAAAGERRILYYRNPMGLPDTSPVPKKDSMGMDYLPVYEGEEDDGSAVNVSAGKLQRTGVKTALATRTAISRPVRVPGTVALDERRVSIVATRTEAFIEEVADITTGKTIAKGQPLVTFYAKEIAAAGALYASDLRNGSRRTAASGGSLQRLENLGMPAEAIAEIEKTRNVPISVTLTAPRDGVVLERMAVDGMMAAPGETLFRIADTSSLWVLADVPEYELSSIKVGAAASVRVRSLPGHRFEGRVDLIYPQIQTETRTARVRIELPNPDGVLMANMYADVEIASGPTEPVVTVPDSAVIDTGDRQVVIVDKGEGKFEPRDVQLGMRGSGMTEIKEGVADGDRVVVSANFLIDAESNLKAALSALTTVEAKP